MVASSPPLGFILVILCIGSVPTTARIRAFGRTLLAEFVASLLLAVIRPLLSPASAQLTPAVRPLGSIEAHSRTPLRSVWSVRALDNGNVLVQDRIGRTVSLLN